MTSVPPASSSYPDEVIDYAHSHYVGLTETGFQAAKDALDHEIQQQTDRIVELRDEATALATAGDPIPPAITAERNDLTTRRDLFSGVRGYLDDHKARLGVQPDPATVGTPTATTPAATTERKGIVGFMKRHPKLTGIVGTTVALLTFGSINKSLQRADDQAALQQLQEQQAQDGSTPASQQAVDDAARAAEDAAQAIEDREASTATTAPAPVAETVYQPGEVITQDGQSDVAALPDGTQADHDLVCIDGEMVNGSTPVSESDLRGVNCPTSSMVVRSKDSGITFKIDVKPAAPATDAPSTTLDR